MTIANLPKRVMLDASVKIMRAQKLAKRKGDQAITHRALTEVNQLFEQYNVCVTDPLLERRTQSTPHRGDFSVFDRVVAGQRGRVLKAALTMKKDKFLTTELEPLLKPDDQASTASALSNLAKHKLLAFELRSQGRGYLWFVTDLGKTVGTVFGMTKAPPAETKVPTDLFGHAIPTKPKRGQLTLHKLGALSHWAYLMGGPIKPDWLVEFTPGTLKKELSGYCGSLSSDKPEKAKYRVLTRLKLGKGITVAYVLTKEGTERYHNTDIRACFEGAGWPFPTDEMIQRARAKRDADNIKSGSSRSARMTV